VSAADTNYESIIIKCYRTASIRGLTFIYTHRIYTRHEDDICRWVAMTPINDSHYRCHQNDNEFLFFSVTNTVYIYMQHLTDYPALQWSFYSI